MANLAPQERLQPALLDRLIDDHPDQKQEVRESRLITSKKLRVAVLRDLAWLFNCTRQSDEELDPLAYPHAARSVVNYGLPSLAGTTLSGIDAGSLETRIREAILLFEPRLVAETLVVQALVSEKASDHHNQIQIEIQGNLWAQPIPLEMLLRTEMDLESGEVRIQDMG